MTLVERLQAAQARQRAASARHDLSGVAAAKAQVAYFCARIAARRAA